MSQKDLVFNPYMPFWEYVPDGEPHVFGDRLYVYGSHDARNGEQYCSEDYVVWSAPVDDLSQWRCDGVSYRRTDDPRYAPEGKDMMAPDVCQGPDGKYYLYYFNDMRTLSVAVANDPAGPFSFYGVVHMTDGSPLPGLAFDPGILCDDTGIWLYYGFDTSAFGEGQRCPEPGCFAVELQPDMLTCKHAPSKVLEGSQGAVGTPFEGHAFFEASSIRRIGKTYYLVHSSELGHELCYCTSDRPTGPFSYGGTIVSNADLGYRGNNVPTAYPANTHGGLVCVEGQWYVFYHRHTHERQYSRQACAEKIEIASDGSISQVEMTSCGLSDAPLPLGNTYPAHIACGLCGPEGVVHISSRVHRRPSDPFLFQEGSDCNEKGDGCMYAANLRSGSSLAFKYFEGAPGIYECALECRGDFDGVVEVFAISHAGVEALVGEIRIAGGETATWSEFRGEVVLEGGVFGLKLSPRGDGSLDIKSVAVA